MMGSNLSTRRWTWLSEQPILLAHSRVGLWRGFEFQEIRVAEEGTCDGASPALHLSQACGPIKVRPTGRRKLYTDLSTRPELYMPGRHRRGHWRGAQRGLHLFVEPDAFERLMDLSLHDRRFVHPERSPPAIDPLLHALLIDTRSGHPSGPMLGEAIVVAILRQLVGDEPATADGRARTSTPTTGLHRAIDLIDANFASSLHLDDLASEAGLSARHFTRVFRTAMGCSPYHFIQRRRVDRARDLIRSGRFSLREVAAMTGFAHQAHMADTFRKVLGVPPSHYGNR